MLDIEHSLPALLRGARQSAGLSQRELARRAHTTQSVVARIELGNTTPTFDTLRRLLAAAGVDLQIALTPRAAPDPVVESYKRAIDRTLLRENLRKSPDQRVRGLIAMAKFADEARRARGKSKRRS
jgi:transcriptional regulator with XRE-family HTH domain